MRLARRASGRNRSPSPAHRVNPGGGRPASGSGRPGSSTGVRGGAASADEEEAAVAHHAELERPLEEDVAADATPVEEEL
eukprot:7744953-Alexandrium_andersonii.AAC.1